MKTLFLFSALVATPLWARPPRDLILTPPSNSKGMRVLRNKNITYTNDQAEEKGGSGIIRIQNTVKGRSRPDRSGSILSLIPAGSVVSPFKWSKDRKWVAVVVRNSGIRVWVPLATLPEIDSNLKLLKKEDQESSSSSSSKGGATTEEE